MACSNECFHAHGNVDMNVQILQKARPLIEYYVFSRLCVAPRKRVYSPILFVSGFPKDRQEGAF